MFRIPTRIFALFWVIVSPFAATPAVTDAKPQPLLVAAASDLRFALAEIVGTYREQSGTDIRVTYGSSGNLARQISQGAPFELFLSADESYVQRLASDGLTRDKGLLYAVGRIVLFAPNGATLVPDPELRDLRAKMADGSLRRLAIANPEHAPYGRAAEQALRSLRLWDSIQPALLFGENISQAAQFAVGGNADGGIIAYSLAIAPEFREQGRYALIADALHAPLRQRMVLMRDATADAEKLYAHLRSTSSREILVRYGFALPGY